MLLAIAMASRCYSREEVVGLLDSDDEEEVDDPQEVFMEGSDEEFDDLDEIENGTNTMQTKQYCIE